MTVDWDAKTITKNLIENNTTDITVERRKDVAKTYNTQNQTVIIEENNNRGVEQGDVQYQSQDKQVSVYITLLTNSDDLNSLWQDVKTVLDNHRRNIDGLPGGWDKLYYESINFDDNDNASHQLQQANMRITFVKTSDII